MRICVSGGAGFIGSPLVDRLVSEGYKVTVVDDLSNGSISNLSRVQQKITFLRRDVSLPFYNEFPKSTNADTIFHLACFPRSMSFENPTRDVEVNINGMVNVLELARKTGAKVIFSSNSGIYDTSKLPINEGAEDTPKTPYDLNKLTAERYLKLYHETYGVPYTIFRFATVYGPRQKTSPKWKPVVIEFIDKLSKGQAPTIYWDGEQTRDFINVRDIVNALVLAKDSRKSNGETMILGSGVETSINQLYKAVCNQLGVDLEPKRGPQALGDIAQMRYDCSLAHRILGWKPQVSLKEGIAELA